MEWIELLLLMFGVLVLPLWLLLEPSWKVQSWLMAVEIPILVWLTWQLATYS